MKVNRSSGEPLQAAIRTSVCSSVISQSSYKQLHVSSPLLSTHDQVCGKYHAPSD
ncbi:hypothetical protein [Dyadobacter sp. CY323]|uniref:hypothetical protein n=1 Tax=Dyadobacter sp. CY323 TaxID=2907302 RepID=UPI001F1E3C7E|nr:hypothetical protein [Dyadobacter sp. CY323]MCE6993109.1 hypothetical protein [Dyadobacter sp. CY323]